MRRLLSEIDLLGDGLRPVRISAGAVVYPPGGRLGPRWQHDVELVLLHTGSARIAVDEAAPLVLRPEFVALLLPAHREIFRFDAAEATHHSWVQLGLTGPVPGPLTDAPRVIPASSGLTELVRAATAAHRPAASAIAVQEHLAAALAAAAIWRYLSDAEAGAGDPAAVAERARWHLDARIAETGLNLGRLAAAVHVTPAHLVRRFRAEFGTTPMAYLWRRRVAAGVELLTNTGLPVGEVARRSGFRSVYHFSRRVKQETGLAPTELRRRGWSRGS